MFDVVKICRLEWYKQCCDILYNNQCLTTTTYVSDRYSAGRPIHFPCPNVQFKLPNYFAIHLNILDDP